MRQRKGILSIDIIEFAKKCGLILLETSLFLSVDLSSFSPRIDTLINILKVVSFFIFAATWIAQSFKNKLSTGAVLMIVLTGLIGISTLVNGADITYYLIVWGGFIGVVFLVESIGSRNFCLMISTLRITLSILIIVNCITVIVFPSGLWTEGVEGYWLIGHRNSFGPLLITGIAVCAIYDQFNHRSFSPLSVIVYLASLFSTISTWSATSVLTVSAAVGVSLLIIIKPSKRFPNPFAAMLAYAAMDIGIVFFNIQYHLQGFLNHFLHRTASLTGRVQLWAIVKERISEAPILGYGVLRSGNNGLTVYSPAYVHAHNGWLDVMHTGGIVSLITYIGILLLATKAVYKHRTEKIAQLAFACLVIHLIYSITNIFISSYTILILMIIFNLDRFITQKGTSND